MKEPQNRTTYLIVAALVAMVFIVLTVILVLSLERHDLGSLLGEASTSIVALIGLLGVYHNQSEQRSDVREIKRNVNGNLDKLRTELLKAQNLNKELLARMTPSQIDDMQISGKENTQK